MAKAGTQQDIALAELLDAKAPARKSARRSRGKTVKAVDVELEIKEPRVVSSADRAKAWIAENGPFTFVERRTQRFQCAACSGYGKHAVVLKDKKRNLVMLGGGCLKYANVKVPIGAKRVG